MASIFNTLNIGYSGLNAAQLEINTTSQNVANANTPGYSRQTVMTAAAQPLNTTPGAVGNGVQVQQIARIFDQFTFNSYSAASADKQASDFTQNTLQQLSTYFPSDSTGIKSNLNAYYTAWQSLSDNPDNNAVKVALGQQTQVLAQSIQSTKSQITSLQGQLNDQLKTDIDQVNTIASQIADLNKSINIAEAGGANNANDLRDQRNNLELSLSNLIGANAMSTSVSSNNAIDPNYAEDQGSESISINGFNLVDGSGFHPLVLNNNNQSGMYEVSYQRQDGTLIPFTQEISGGTVGALLSLRGSTLDSTTGQLTNGALQNVSDQLDSLASGLIQSTNNIYAQSATTSMQSNSVIPDPSQALTISNLGVKTGSFNVLVYDVSGNVVAQRTIKIDNLTTTTGAAGSDSIQGQMSANIDDNGDNNSNNDVDDFLSVNAANNGVSISFKNSSFQSQGYTFAIKDNLDSNNTLGSGTNFAGALGLNKFFDGTDASTIDLANNLKKDPTQIASSAVPSSGDNAIAMDMVQSQFSNVDFTQKNSNATSSDTVLNMFDAIATNVGTQTNAAVSQNGTITARYSAAQQQYTSVSGVNMDEEMTNLIKYQTSYGASAKIITTIQTMMDTLLGLKQ